MTDITDLSQWEQYAHLQEQGIFLQSGTQRALYEGLGQKTWLLEKDQIRSLVTKVEAKRGTFLYLPYGPLCANPIDSFQDLQAFFTELKMLAEQEAAAFIRISPYWSDTPQHAHLLKRLGFRQAPIHMLAETLWVLNLEDKTEEELMMGMEKKHRNLVRRAAKDGVSIHHTTEAQAVEQFLELHWETVKRHQFTPYPKEYFRQQVKRFAARDEVKVLEARLNDELLASAIIMYYGKSAAYHHGASSSKPEHRKIPASYLLQWEAIQEAKRRGCTTYNFWGISPDKNPKHPFFGITHFKTGFGGQQFDLIPCHDLVINPKYYLNWIVETARKWRRGF